MRPRAVIKRYVFPDAGFRGRGAIVGMQIDFFVFERSPEALDRDIVAPLCHPYSARCRASHE